MKFLQTLLFLAVLAPVQGQHALITDFSWAEHPMVPDTVLHMTETEVVLQRKIVLQRMDEGDQVVEYSLFHYAGFLRDAAAIENNNKVYIDLDDVLDIRSLKARTISPDGQVFDLKDDAFKRAEDEQKQRSYLYFAFEGLTPGSVIEYVVVLKKTPNLRGAREMLQFDVPVLRGSFDLLGPSRLEFAVKSYNGAPQPVLDTTEAGTQHFHLELRNVPGLPEEPVSAPHAHRMQLIHKLDKVIDRDLRDYSGYVAGTKLYHAALYPELSVKAQKELSAFVEKMALLYARNDEDKVRTLEEYIKARFSLASGGPELHDLSTMIRTRTCDKTGLCMLFCQVLRTIGMEHQVVVNNDRSAIPFDPDFGSFYFLQDVHLLLPTLNKFLSPTEFGLRLGWLPAWNMDNDALFIRNYDIGGSITGVGKPRHIDALPDSVNTHTIRTKVVLSSGADSANVRMEARMTGYFCQGIQPYYGSLSGERMAELHTDLAGFLLENSASRDVRVENGEGKYMGVRPLILHVEVSTADLSGSAGDKKLFNIGELIGPQSELYTKDQRRLPIDAGFNRRYERDLEVILPDGYTLQNGAELAMDHHFGMDGEPAASFISTWTLEGRILKVRVDERYARCTIPPEMYASYRDVVNAAADFSKLKIVLTKD